MKFIINTSTFKQTRDEPRPNFKFRLISKKTKEFLFLQ